MAALAGYLGRCRGQCWHALVGSEREVLLRAALDAQNYSGHSFRAENGGAACGVEGSLRWMEQFCIFVVCAGPGAAVHK